MPEGPEVRIVADWLRERYSGAWLNPIKPLEFDSSSRYALTRDDQTLRSYALECYSDCSSWGIPYQTFAISSEMSELSKLPLGATLEQLGVVITKRMERRRLIGYDLLYPTPGWTSLRIETVLCKGKKIFFQIAAKQGSEESVLYLSSSLGLEGKWISQAYHLETKSGRTPFRSSSEKYTGDSSLLDRRPGISDRRGELSTNTALTVDPKHSNLWLNLSRVNIESNTLEIEALLYNDVRHMGDVRILDEVGFREKWTSIGPDLLAEDVPDSVWLECISRPRLANKQICDFLMDQKYFSGIGNYLKAEILYGCRIKPDRPLSSLTEKEKRLLLSKSSSIIRDAHSNGGLTIRSFYSPTGATGTFRVLVYNQSSDPNGYPVEKSVFKDKRTTHWVPAVQR